MRQGGGDSHVAASKPYRGALWCVLLGALAWPGEAMASPPLDLPWRCGETRAITQGHQVGSHTAKGAWAWDAGMSEGEEVVAVADGVVRRARGDSTRYGCHEMFANDGNYVVLDFEDGTEALYLHLQAGSVTVQEGERVERGQIIGKVGKSGWICGAVNEGVHLHFQIQRTCTSWYCQSIEARFDMLGDLGSARRYRSTNCGDNMVCEIGAETTRVIDEHEACFRRVTQWWWEEAREGVEDRWLYTYAIDAAEPDTQGWWRFSAREAGEYALEVHVPPGAQSRQARYEVEVGGEIYGAYLVDQSAQQGWVHLGVLTLEAGSEGHVTLGDATGERYSEDDKRRLAFDAVRFTLNRKTTNVSQSDDGALLSEVSPKQGEVQSGGGVSGVDMSSSDDGFEAQGGELSGEGSLCAVVAPGHARESRAALLWLLGGVVLGWRQRRRRAQ